MLTFDRPRQRNASSVRPVLFQSQLDGNSYFSSFGGTVVLIRSKDKLFGVTCQHTLGGHSGRDLTVHFDLSSDVAYKPNLVVTVDNGGVHYLDTEVEDVFLCRWDNPHDYGLAIKDAITLEEYRDPEKGDTLAIAGFLKSRSDYEAQPAQTFCFETFVIDQGIQTADPLMRTATIELDTEEEEASAGLSGGLVFNLTKNGPAGIIVRGGAISRHFKIHYLPFNLIKNTIEFIETVPI